MRLTKVKMSDNTIHKDDRKVTVSLDNVILKDDEATVYILNHQDSRQRVRITITCEAIKFEIIEGEEIKKKDVYKIAKVFESIER